MMNRRKFVGAAVTLPFALRAMAQMQPKWAATPRWVFLGTDKGKGIYRARWDVAKGVLGPLELAVETDRPDFFALHPQLPVLYTVDSVSGEKAGVSGYRVDRASGALTLINRVSSHGDGPCAVSVTHDGRYVFVANYTGGSFDGYALQPDGTMRDRYSAYDCRRLAKLCGPVGPVAARQEAAHLHCAVIAPNDDYALVCDLGDDAIEIFPIASYSSVPPGNLDSTYGNPIKVKARAGSGPRHVAFHPNRKWVYCIHEIDCTVDLYDWSAVDGKPVMTLREGSAVPTLSKGVALAGNTACEVFVSPDGRFVYTCTRGVDEILVFRVDAKSGLLTEHQRLTCGGPVPRYIALDPSGKWLVSTNQGSAAQPAGNVAVFARDTQTGKLGETPRVFAAETPMFISWV